MKYSKVVIDNFFKTEEIFKRKDNVKSESLKYFFIGLFLAVRKFYEISDEGFVNYEENEKGIFNQFSDWMISIRNDQTIELEDSLKDKEKAIKCLLEDGTLESEEFYYIVGEVYFKIWSSIKRKERDLAEDILLSSIYEIEKTISYETWLLENETETILVESTNLLITNDSKKENNKLCFREIIMNYIKENIKNSYKNSYKNSLEKLYSQENKINKEIMPMINSNLGTISLFVFLKLISIKIYNRGVCCEN